MAPDAPFSTNFIVEVKGRREFPCHKEILARRSPYFNRLLGGDWRESKLLRLKLEDVTAVEMEWVLKSLYKHAALPVPHDNAEQAASADQSSSSSSAAASTQEAEPLAVRLLLLADRFGKAVALVTGDVGGRRFHLMTRDVRNAVGAGLDYVKDGLEEELSKYLEPANVLGLLMSAQKSEAQTLEAVCRNFLLLGSNLHGALKAMEGPTDPAEAVALVEALRKAGHFRLLQVPCASRAVHEVATVPPAAEGGPGGQANA